MIQFNPFVSIIIPSYDREEVLCNTIRYVLAQNYNNYELLIIDQTENHDHATNAFLSQVPPHVRVINHRPPSLPGARNRGIKEAKGEIIIMIDDDVIIKNDFVSQHVKHYINDSVHAVTGMVDQKAKYINRIPSFLNNEFLQWVSAQSFQNPNPGEAFRIAGGNFSIRKNQATIAGEFDENFIGTSWGEEFDFSLRLKQLGIKIVYDPEAMIYHLNEKSGGCRSRGCFEDNIIFSKSHNLSYLIEKNKSNRLLYIYLIFYLYKQVVIKKAYLSLRGLFFWPKINLLFIKGFVKGFKEGKNRIY